MPCHAMQHVIVNTAIKFTSVRTKVLVAQYVGRAVVVRVKRFFSFGRGIETRSIFIHTITVSYESESTKGMCGYVQISFRPARAKRVIRRRMTLYQVKAAEDGTMK